MGWLSSYITVPLGTIPFYTGPPNLKNRSSSSSSISWCSHSHNICNTFVQHQIPTIYIHMIWVLDYLLCNLDIILLTALLSLFLPAFLCTLYESHYYPGLKYTVMLFSYEYSFLCFQNCFSDLINYLLTPQLFPLVLLMSVASARVVWLNVTYVTSKNLVALWVEQFVITKQQNLETCRECLS